MEYKLDDRSYEMERRKVMFDMSAAKWWQELSLEEQLKITKITAENKYAAEVQLAKYFERLLEPIKLKIKRFLSDYETLAQQYPL